MNCAKCGSQNIQVISGTTEKTAKCSSLKTVVHIFLTICTLGLLVIIPFIMERSKGKFTNKKKAICLNCGNSWFIYEFK